MMTEEQRKLAEDNHNLIYDFIHKNGLNVDDYYDIFAIGLCKAAINYDSTKGEFSTLAFECMRNYFKNHLGYINKKGAIPQNQLMSYNACLVDVLDGEADESFINSVILGSEFDVSEFVIGDIIHFQFLNLLKDRERVIVKLLESGLNQRQIAEKINVSQQIVSFNVKNIRKKWLIFNNR